MDSSPEAARFGLYRPRLLRESTHFLGALKAEAPDMVQDTFWVAFPRLAAHDSPVPAYAWLRQVCLRLCYARLRDSHSALQCLDAELSSAMRLRGIEAPATENLEVRLQQRLELLREMIKGLSPLSRQAIELRNMHGMSYALVASTLGLSPPALLRRLSQARSELRALSGAPGRIPVAA